MWHGECIWQPPPPLHHFQPGRRIIDFYINHAKCSIYKSSCLYFLRLSQLFFHTGLLAARSCQAGWLTDWFGCQCWDPCKKAVETQGTVQWCPEGQSRNVAWHDARRVIVAHFKCCSGGWWDNTELEGRGKSAFIRPGRPLTRRKEMWLTSVESTRECMFRNEWLWVTPTKNFQKHEMWHQHLLDCNVSVI